MTGSELLRTLQRSQPWRSVPVILVTGTTSGELNSADATVVTCLKTGEHRHTDRCGGARARVPAIWVTSTDGAPSSRAPSYSGSTILQRRDEGRRGRRMSSSNSGLWGRVVVALD